FAGYSYGSVLGQIYANLFPDRVGRLIVDGVLDIESWVGDVGPLARGTSTLGERLRSDLGAEDTFEEFLEQCDAAGPDVCPLGPDAAERVDALFEGARTEPIVITDPFTGEEVFTLAYADLVVGTLSNLYDTNSWFFTGQDLAFFEFVQNSPEPPVMGFEATMSRLQGAREWRAQPKYPNFVEGFPGVACVDTSNPVTFRSWDAAVERLSAESPTFADPWTWSDSVCHRWPGKDTDRFVGPFGQETDTPILMLSTVHDPATSLQQAQLARDGMPGSVLVTVEGSGHTTLFTSTCVDDLTAAYLLDGVVPADGTSCEQDLSIPFAVPGGPDATEQDGRAVLLREVGSFGI
ncbi:MAG: alpha/beta hydrolase, partial [Ilumatobacter sp.]